ncbi:MAG: PH domain-containing protein [Streptosporangiaceae bacterium]|nr:PH domain-containing protein [Streptosporangiaceae bacterium]
MTEPPGNPVTVPPGPNEQWHRLHPLSPLIQAGRLLAGLLSVLIITLAQNLHRGYQARIPDLILVVVLVIAAIVRWLVTRWRLDGSTLRIETGLLRRDSKQLPVTRIQAVDVVRPLLARVLGLAELRIRLAGSSDRADGRLAYLTEQQAASVRAMLLAAHYGLDPATPEPAEQAVSQLPAGRLVAASLLWGGLTFVALALVVAVVAALAPWHVFVGLLGSLLVYALGLATATWRRISSSFGFTVALSPDGIRIRRGLLGTVAETVPVRRIQAVSMVQPLLWRPFGWCSLRVDVAGHAGHDEGSRNLKKDLLPVGSTAEARYLAQLALGHEAPAPSKPPRSARVKAPLSYHFLAAGHDAEMAVAVTGRLTRTTVWMRLEKVQSVRYVQGPVQRRLGLASVYADAAGRRVHAVFRDRTAQEAEDLLRDLAALSRTARRGETHEAEVRRFPVEPGGGE